ncbi:MAG TPA: hypothetical protein VNQ80_05975 [Parapedobacter sp.]|uniref:hypothetical protein n=1 Tax=Parapedobacter sp. TaxID=1958893 RepID=UPI002CD917BF|nr:hypothetical protein [Parapedobacter sp.]HWK56861.1 hypothetical protein [Parapedobacter sp.]
MIQIKNIHFIKALRLWPAVFVLIVLSCQNESRNNASEAIQEDPASEIAADIGAPLPALPYIAVFDDESEQLEAEKNTDFDRTSLTVDALTLALRTNYPEIELEVDRISNDTLFVRIADASYLTQQMGSSGARVYIMEATYAYTELPDIEVVHFDFAEGDHAIPGNYTRRSFNNRPVVR